MRVGVGGGELDRHLVGLDRLLHASSLVENVAQIEIGQRIARIGLQRSTIVFLRQSEILAIVVQGSQVDVRGRVLRLKLEYFLICSQRFGLRGRIFFERNAARKPHGSFVLLRPRLRRRNRRAGDDFFS